MKKTLFIAGVITLLSTSGCLVSEGGGHGHSHGRAHYESHSEVIVAAPVVVARPPEIIVPVVRVHPY
jgi:hypothetical protein